MSWTDERVELLKKLWGEGRTAAEIAGELGGVTRNAVIGKAHRLKLSGRASPIQASAKKKAAANSNAAQDKPAKKVVKTAKSKKVAAAKVEKTLTSTKEVEATVNKQIVSPVLVNEISEKDKKRKRVSLQDLAPNQCRWPIGDPRDKNFGFCGCKTEPGEVYCTEHRAMAYQVVARGRKLNAEDLEREEKARAEKMAASGDQY